jgi:PAS domain S-box-containing protein/diguanylate cyclase (GGDEF)-like protein
MIEDNEFYWKLLDTMKDGVCFANKKRKLTYWNKAAEELTGYRSGEVLGRGCCENILIHIDLEGDILCENKCPMRRAMDIEKTVECKLFLHHKDGHRVPVTVRVNPVKNKKGEVIGAVQIFSDRSAKELFMDRMQKLEHSGYVDPLTKIPNQKYIELHLKTRFWVMSQAGLPFGILYMKIDQMEEIKKNYGPKTVEHVLKNTAQTFINNMTPLDLIGRWEEEAFMGVFRNVDKDELDKIAHMYRVLVEKTSFFVDQQPLTITISTAPVLAEPTYNEKTIVEKAKKVLLEKG